MKKKEKLFCRLTAVTGDPRTAAQRAGYKRPDEAWPELISRPDTAAEIRRVTREVGGVLKETLLCAACRQMSAENTDAVRLLYHEQMSDEALSGLNLSGVAEIKRTKDKSVEIKFFDKVKALSVLNGPGGIGADSAASGGLLEAMRLSARALREMRGGEDESHAD